MRQIPAREPLIDRVREPQQVVAESGDSHSGWEGNHAVNALIARQRGRLDESGTRMAAAGTPLRTLQGWTGHRDPKTTEIYADFAPDPTQGARWAQRVFGGVPRDAAARVERREPGPLEGPM
jgi:hypothetical protein